MDKWKNNQKVICLILNIISILTCCFFVRRIYTNMNRYTGVLLNVYIVGFIVSIIGVVLFSYTLFHEVKKENMFLIIGGVFGSLLMILLPVRVAPDETKHAMTSYKVSDWILQDNQTSDDFFYMRSCDMDMFSNDWNLEWDPSSEAYEAYYSKLLETNENQELEKMDLSMGLSADYIAYTFSSLGISVGRVFHLNAFITLMLGRIFNFIFYLLMVYFAIKIIPVGKQLLMTIALFPVALQQGMSYSYDSPIIALSLLVIACSISIYYYGLEKIKHKKLMCVCLLLASLFLIMVKSHAYIFLGLFPLVAIFKQLGWLNEKVMKWIKRILITIIVLIVVVCIWDRFIGIPTIIQSGSEKLYSFAWVVNHPYKTLCLYLATFKELGVFYYTTMISSALGWLNIVMPFSVLVIYSMILVFNLFKRDNESCLIDGTMRLFSFGTFLLTLVCVMMGMLLFWTTDECTTIGGVQGRYLIPVFFLCCIGLKVNKIQVPSKLDFLSNVGIVCSYLMIINYLLNRF